MNKKIIKTLQPQTPNTIDEKHTEMLNQFHNNIENQIPKLTQEIADLKARAKTLGDHQIEEYMEIRDKILLKKKMIKKLFLHSVSSSFLLSPSLIIYKLNKKKKKTFLLEKIEINN
jgi:hypothetical protein